MAAFSMEDASLDLVMNEIHVQVSLLLYVRFGTVPTYSVSMILCARASESPFVRAATDIEGDQGPGVMEGERKVRVDI